MSYVNNDKLYVFKSAGGGLVCSTKPIQKSSLCLETKSRDKMITHLKFVHSLPDFAFNRLEKEIKEFGDVVCDCQWDDSLKKKFNT